MDETPLGKKLPERSGTGVAEDSVWPAGEDRSHPDALLAQCRMADGVNPAMNAVQAACLDTAGQALATNTDALELLQRDHTVLLGGNVGKGRVRAGVGYFLTHVRE